MLDSASWNSGQGPSKLLGSVSHSILQPISYILATKRRASNTFEDKPDVWPLEVPPQELEKQRQVSIFKSTRKPRCFSCLESAPWKCLTVAFPISATRVLLPPRPVKRDFLCSHHTTALSALEISSSSKLSIQRSLCSKLRIQSVIYNGQLEASSSVRCVKCTHLISTLGTCRPTTWPNWR